MAKINLEEVLFLTLYPIHEPRHGGQHRASNLIKMYERVGYKVNHLYSIYETDPWVSLEGDYYVIPARSLESVKYDVYVPEIADFLMGLYLSKDEGMINKVLTYIKNKNIKIIHIEQPWLYPLIDNIKKAHYNLFEKITLIYGSQNLEFNLKESMIPRDVTCRLDMLEDIKALEINAAMNADIVLAVSTNEKNILSKWNDNTILARNGVSLKKIKFSDEGFASEHLNQKYFLFVGSAHKPNLDGFIELVGGALGCVPPDMKLAVVGGVNHLIHNHPDFVKWRDINKKRILAFPDVTDSQLQVIIDKCEVIILPILSGGGTNLKTAEALLSRKPIIGTSVSFRDFEQFVDESVYIADTRREFQQVMQNHHKQESTSDRDVSKLLWNSCLLEFENFLRVSL